jgi:AcrR family transcriptional regulator
MRTIQGEEPMGRPPKFDRAQVQLAALNIVDHDGAEALTMRNVANVLNTGAMTLYNHVRDRADLEALVADGVFAEVQLPPRQRDWKTTAEHMSVAIWRTLRQHPNAIHYVSTHRGKSLAALDVAEQLLGTLEESHASPADLVIAFRALLAVIIGAIEAEPRRADDETLAEPFAKLIREHSIEHPKLAALTDIATALESEAIFTGMVRQVLNGLPAV